MKEEQVNNRKAFLVEAQKITTAKKYFNASLLQTKHRIGWYFITACMELKIINKTDDGYRYIAEIQAEELNIMPIIEREQDISRAVRAKNKQSEPQTEEEFLATIDDETLLEELKNRGFRGEIFKPIQL